MQFGPAAAVSPPPIDADAPTLADGAAAWSALCAKLKQRAKLDAEIVELTGQVQRSGTIEALEGVTLDTALNLVHRLPGADRAMQLTAADVLGDMPATKQLFANGTLSWGQVRGIVTEARRLTKEQRGVLDATIAASADMFSKLDPDEAIDGVRATCAELRSLRSVERREADAPKSNFVWGQTNLFGGAKMFSELDAVSFATVFSGIDALTPPDDGRSLAQRRAEGLVALATHRCDAGESLADDVESEPLEASAVDEDGAEDTLEERKRGGRARHPALGRDAVPMCVVAVDAADARAALAGTLVLPMAGSMPVLTARLLEALAADATIQAVLFDGGRPLAVGKKVRAKKLPRDVALAVKTRDRGDRFPGSRRPIEHLHHLDKQGKGHDVDALVGLAATSHRRAHRCGWKIAVNPDNREITFTRGKRTWTTLPRGTRLRRPPPRDPPTDRGS